jgi:type IV pilus assembly protein PilE
MKSEKGFTLIELMVVVVIVAILASIGIPAYSDYVTRGKLAEAYANLASQRVKLEQYYQDRRTYLGACAAGTVAPPLTGTYFNYACTLADQTYTITATGNPAKNLSNQFVFTLDQNNNKWTASVGPGWTMPTQTAPSGCWARRKDGSC